MSKKVLQIEQLKNELSGASHFFPKASSLTATQSDTPLPPTLVPEQPKAQPTPIAQELSVVPTPEGSQQVGDTVIPRYQATTIPRHHDTTIENIRAAVKRFGKEAATHRFTQEEKQAIAEVVYIYQRQGIRTSENEIARIGVNFLLEDYRQNGENSILDKALKALKL